MTSVAALVVFTSSQFGIRKKLLSPFGIPTRRSLFFGRRGRTRPLAPSSSCLGRVRVSDPCNGRSGNKGGNAKSRKNLFEILLIHQIPPLKSYFSDFPI
jgi:hypothetical protein